MICLEQQTLVLTIPGCAEHYLESINWFYRIKRNTVIPPEPPYTSLTWENHQRANPLMAHAAKVLVLLTDPAERLASLLPTLVPDYTTLTNHQVNELVISGELFRRFPAETMPAADYLTNLPRPKLPNGGRVRVFHESDPRCWANVQGFLVMPTTVQLATNKRPIIGWNVEAENTIKNYYEKDFDIVPDKSYFL